MTSPLEDPDGFSAGKIGHALRLPFLPSLTRTYINLEKIEDLDVDVIRRRFCGLIIAVVNTLVERDADELSGPVREKLREIRDCMPVCTFGRQLPDFYALRIPMVRNVPRKPASEGFEIGVYRYLQKPGRTRGLVRPEECAMVGSNFLTDGGCRRIGMELIKVRPRDRRAGLAERFHQGVAGMIKGLHDCFR